ncbi:MAG: type I restriction enzyme HsdR N-terminal domain-containing protein [Alistipes sp.]|jgi:hypothetical protein|nr:type I restriction enzyme HsdR N-terminal domain-containing protein [Alistipes sp.]
MDFRDLLLQLSGRVTKQKDQITTEEAAKTAFVLPFIQALGYDIFDPLEVEPEHTCDVGTKKGEKIDYAIMQDGHPILLIECKHSSQNLDLCGNQLFRYFGTSKAKFAVLTDGIQYRFFSDLDAENVMDRTPFLEVDITNLKDNQIEELKKFHKSYFNVGNIRSTAEDLRYINDIRNLIYKDINNPGEEIVLFYGRAVYPGQMKARAREYFTQIVKKAYASVINEIVSERFKTAVQKQEERADEDNKAKTPSDEPKIQTTEEEKEAYHIVKAILRSVVAGDRITYRDAQTYFTVLIDDNNRKLVCRLYLNSPTNKGISFVGDDKKEVRYKIESQDEIDEYTEQIIETVKKFK